MQMCTKNLVNIVIAIAKGRIEKDVYRRLKILSIETDSRKLIFTDENNYSKEETLKADTKYPTIAKNYFKSRGQKIEIIKLNGSVELAPIVGLSDVIVDLVETGNTLKANGLEIVEDMCNISSRIIANRVSYKFKKSKNRKYYRKIWINIKYWKLLKGWNIWKKNKV